MNAKIYGIAGLRVKMESFGRTIDQAEKYVLSDEKYYDIQINSVREELLERHPLTTIDVAEYMGTCVSFYRQLLKYDGMMIHASAVVVDEKAYLFSAFSGTGKSTHTQLWIKLFDKKAYILNDDKPAIRFEDGIWYAYGTPWSGKYDISVNKRVPIAGIAMIERAETNSISKWSGKDAIFALLRQVNRPKDLEYRIKLLELLDILMGQVTIWRLQCNMKLDAAIMSYEAMSGKKYTE